MHEVPRRLKISERSGDIKGEGRVVQLIDQTLSTCSLNLVSSMDEHSVTMHMTCSTLLTSFLRHSDRAGHCVRFSLLTGVYQGIPIHPPLPATGVSWAWPTVTTAHLPQVHYYRWWTHGRLHRCSAASRWCYVNSSNYSILGASKVTLSEIFF